MGYTITIGNAKPVHSKEDGYLDARWVVEGVSRDDAPTFPNDDMTGNSNERSPSYTGWADFCRAAGIYDLFYNDDDGLIRPHPGCVMLSEHHLTTVQAALQKWRTHSTKPPGFTGWPKRDPATGQTVTPDEGKYDSTLARLMWLEWWMRWALANCETPAVENS